VLERYLIAWAQRLKNSSNYQQSKHFFREIFYDIESPYKHYFDLFMIVLIVISTAVVILDKTKTIQQWLLWVDIYLITVVFAMEYLLRLWVAHDIHAMILRQEMGSAKYWAIIKVKLHYIVSLPALIDLIAIFPNFRIIRLLKLYHYLSGASSLFDALLKKRFELIFLGYLLFGITFSFGSIFYLLEYGVNENIDSYVDAIYWALVTISTVGYGDISPVTPMGQMVSMFGIVFGIALISFSTSVMVSAFSERFDKLRNQESIKYANKMRNVVIINGYGYLGATIARKLLRSSIYQPIIIESNEEIAKRIIEDGYKVIHADASSPKIIQKLYQRDNISAMLTLSASDIDNIYFILNAKSVYRDAVVYARINDTLLEAQYRASQVNGLVEPYSIVNERAERYLIRIAKEQEQRITFLGYTQKSRLIIRTLQEKGVDLEVYDPEEEMLEHAREEGCDRVELLSQNAHTLPLFEERLIVCAMREEAFNLYYAITLRSNGFKGTIVALSDTKEDNRKLILAGVSKIFDMYEESAEQFIEMIEESEKQK
jgi:voltage-gated potassium channel